MYEKTLIHGFDQAIVDFQNCISEDFPAMSINTFKNLFNQEWTRDAMAFYGNPLDGLQIMGLLETRLLDFETILVVGMNEGKMPPTNPIQTLIPMDLRQHVGLPLPRDKQGLFAHHFYRLLHTCSEMYITYSSSMEGMNSTEPSRYLLQLELELTKYSSKINFTKKYYTLESNKEITKIKSIVKTNELVERLDLLLQSGISASAIKTFFTCPLDFYYKYVLRFGEEEKVEEAIESNQLGTFVHAVLEELYLPYSLKDKDGIEKTKIPPKILVDDIEHMIKAYPLEMRKQFSIHFNGDAEAFSKGKNYLSFTMAMELTKRFFEFERKRLLALHNTGIRIVALEDKLVERITVNVFGEPKEITLKGVIDRVDELNDEIYIWDYKTGKVDTKDVGKELKKGEDKIAYLVESSKKFKTLFSTNVVLFFVLQTF
jgi:ATP-dependent helicase/DNAse subunit B